MLGLILLLPCPSRRVMWSLDNVAVEEAIRTAAELSFSRSQFPGLRFAGQCGSHQLEKSQPSRFVVHVLQLVGALYTTAMQGW